MTGELQDFQYAVDTTLSIPPTRVRPVHGTRGTETTVARLRLGEALVAAGVITHAQLDACLAHQETAKPRPRLGAVVVERGLATDVEVAQGLATILGFEYVDPSAIDVPVDQARVVPRLSSEMIGAVSIGAGPTWLRVAVADPTDRYVVEALREVTGRLNVSMAVATPRAIEAALHRFWSPDYGPAVTPPVMTLVPDPEPEAPVDEEPAAEARVGDGWEHRFVGDGMPTSHPGYCADFVTTEREVARLGALGWEAVGTHASGARMVVLLKRRLP